MSWLFQPLLLLVAGSTDSALAKQVEFLKAENAILRKRIPKRVFLAPDDRRLLVKLGLAVGSGVAALLTVVSYSTFRGWVKAMDPSRAGTPKPAGAKGKGGRPRTPDDIRALVLKLAKENDWGYTRILGELRKLGITKVCRTTVVNILRENDLDPKTDPGKGTWADFLKAHAQTLWQCDFFSKHIVTAQGIRQCFVLAFLHVSTRRVFLSPCSFKPDQAWMQAQAAAFLTHAKEQNLPAEVILRDHDSKFTGPFDATLADGGARAKTVGFRAPNQNAYVGRFVQAIGQECLDKFVVFGREHLDHVVAEYAEHYRAERPHQSKGNAPLVPSLPTASAPPEPTLGPIACRERLGGVLRHYYREPATAAA